MSDDMSDAGERNNRFDSQDLSWIPFGGKSIAEMTDDDPLKSAALAAQRLVTQIVYTLGSQKDNEPVARLARLGWEIIGQRLVSVATGEIEQMAFFCAKKDGRLGSVVLVPRYFAQLYEQNPILQTGAMVFTLSQARDFWRGVFDDMDKLPREEREAASRRVTDRARAYEAEFLLTITKLRPNFSPNELQRKVLAKFPAGIESFDPSDQVEEFKGKITWPDSTPNRESQ